MKTELSLHDLENLRASYSELKLFRTMFGEVATFKRIVNVLHQENPSGGKFERFSRQGLEAFLMSLTTEITEAMLANGANPFVYHVGAFLWAAQNGRTEVVRILFQYGVNAEGVVGNALELSAENNHVDTVQFLLETGVVRSEDALFALDGASARGNSDIVRLLLRHGADPRVHFNVSIQQARIYEHWETFRILNEFVQTGIVS